MRHRIAWAVQQFHVRYKDLEALLLFVSSLVLLVFRRRRLSFVIHLVYSRARLPHSLLNTDVAGGWDEAWGLESYNLHAVSA